ncbi:hypothetical protein KLP28_03155 [Nocardioidaceae bacterium]|nr:hypothetical protein KLP28_03155 [Nocardioidaceae bacterium]
MRLLDLQALDSRLDSLQHKLASLPESAQLAELVSRRGDIDAQARDAAVLADDLERDRKRADADVEQARTRRERDQQRLDAGSASPKDLERISHEMVSLKRRIDELEDAELEIMERLEAATTMRDDLAGQRDDLDEQIEALRRSRDEKAGEVQVEAGAVQSERARMVAEIPDDLLALYVKLRERHGGVGAAALHRRACGGCRLTLNSADLADIAAAAPDQVVRCEECDRILVRTPESGI